MKKYFCFSFWVFLGGICFGQIDPVKTTVEDSPVLDEVVHEQGKDTLVIQRIEQPELLRKESQDGGVSEEGQPEGEGILTKTFIVSATTYDQKETSLKIWPSHLGERFAIDVWSNIDWSVFKSAISFDNGSSRYLFMLLHTSVNTASNGSEEEGESGSPDSLPEFEGNGARYLVTSSEETEREETLDFLEAIHALYDEDREELHQKYEIVQQQQNERRRQIELETEASKIRVLKIWRHTREEHGASNE